MASSGRPFSDGDSALSQSAGNVYDSPVVGNSKQTRQLTVTDMLTGKDNSSKRPRQSESPTSVPAQDSGVIANLNSESLQAIQKLIESSARSVVATFQARFDSFERRLDVLEGELHGQHQQVQRLQKELEAVKEENNRLAEQIEDMDVNRRSNTLIFKCKDFEPRQAEERIEEMLIKVVTERFPDVKLSEGDIQTAHRLQADNTIICKFTRTRMKELLYDKRITLARQSKENSTRNPLFINESLTKQKRELFNGLLEAKRKGKVTTAFTRRGIPYFKRQPGDRNVRLDSWDKLRAIQGGAECSG